MKKWFYIAFLTFSLFLLAMPAYASTAEEHASVDAEAVSSTKNILTVQYGAKTVTCENEIIQYGDFTFLPLREVLEAYGVSLSWASGEAETKVIITAGQERFQLVLDLKKQLAYGLDGKEYMLYHVDNTLYLPVHFFVQLVNCEASWDKENALLILHENKKKEAAQIITTGQTGVSYHWVMNLPTYEKTVASRYSGLRPSISNGEIYETGKASYYGGKFHGRKTASGERYDQYGITAAHKTLPFGTIVRVTAEWNQQSVDVRINDRGPFVRGRIIDLSVGAAKELGLVGKGVGNVTLEIVAWPE